MLKIKKSVFQNSAFNASLSNDLALGDKEHSDAFGLILIGSVL